MSNLQAVVHAGHGAGQEDQVDGFRNEDDSADCKLGPMLQTLAILTYKLVLGFTLFSS